MVESLDLAVFAASIGASCNLIRVSMQVKPRPNTMFAAWALWSGALATQLIHTEVRHRRKS